MTAPALGKRPATVRPPQAVNVTVVPSVEHPGRCVHATGHAFNSRRQGRPGHASQGLAQRVWRERGRCIRVAQARSSVPPRPCHRRGGRQGRYQPGPHRLSRGGWACTSVTRREVHKVRHGSTTVGVGATQPEEQQCGPQLEASLEGDVVRVDERRGGGDKAGALIAALLERSWINSRRFLELDTYTLTLVPTDVPHGSRYSPVM
jgi:hypothetical protein